ncbi:unnamed protein product [Symbiodinium sp. CCMP2592]|nr:unnamed protein product [Symbiodinium sp. CCMP2592]
MSFEDSPRPPRNPPPTKIRPQAATVRRLQAVKQEVPEPSRSSKDPDRQAKIKALAAQIRAKARRAAEEEDAEVEPEEAPRMPPDEQDTARLEGMIQGLDQKVAHTEDEIERIGILAAPLSMEVTEDIKELQANAIRDTERAVRAAKLNFDSALRDVDRAEREVAALAAPDQAQFSASLVQLKERLQEAQGKLEDHKNVRRDYEQAAQAGKAFGDLASRLSTVEMDCDKAAIMAEPVAKTLDTNPQTVPCGTMAGRRGARSSASGTDDLNYQTLEGNIDEGTFWDGPLLVAYGIEEMYNTTGQKGHSCMPAWLKRRWYEVNGTQVSIDIRGMWPSDTQARAEGVEGNPLTTFAVFEGPYNQTEFAPCFRVLAKMLQAMKEIEGSHGRVRSASLVVGLSALYGVPLWLPSFGDVSNEWWAIGSLPETVVTQLRIYASDRVAAPQTPPGPPPGAAGPPDPANAAAPGRPQYRGTFGAAEAQIAMPATGNEILDAVPWLNNN